MQLTSTIWMKIPLLVYPIYLAKKLAISEKRNPNQNRATSLAHSKIKLAISSPMVKISAVQL